MFKYAFVYLISVLALFLANLYGIHVKAEETPKDSEVQSGENENGTEIKDNWIENLAWNLLGYATIIVPSAIFIRVLKNSNFNERSGK